jgi:hypothetical protein
LSRKIEDEGIGEEKQARKFGHDVISESIFQSMARYEN